MKRGAARLGLGVLGVLVGAHALAQVAQAGAVALAAVAPVAAAQAAPAAMPAAASAVEAAAAPVLAAPAPESYTAETSYLKLVKQYPFIRVASRALPPTVAARRDVSYVQYGARALQLDLYRPLDGARGALPAIVLVHGGGWRVGVRANLAPLAIALAERGYAAATISYRLSGEARYPAPVHDVNAAVRWLRAHALENGIDGGRIAVGGGSAGGQIAALAGVTHGNAYFDPVAPGAGPHRVSSAVQAIVNIDGLSDFTLPAALAFEDDPAKQPSAAAAWFGGRYAAQPARWREASPRFHVSAATPPILFIGSAQPRFSLGREEMVRALDAAGVPNETVLLADTPHSFWLFDPWLAPTAAAIDGFLARYMKK